MDDPGGDVPPDKHGENKKQKTNIPECLYSDFDLGPYMVYLESTDIVGFSVGKVNNIKIARDIFNLNLIDVKKINNKGLNRIAIEFNNAQAANNMVKNQTLKEKGYKIFIPFNFVSCKGICRQVDSDISEEELLKCASAGSYAGHKVEILSVKRLNRKIINDSDKSFVYEPTGTVLFTFKGVVLPNSVKFYHLERPIQIYVPPVTQCYKCLRFGHTNNNCRGREKCFNCGGEEKHTKDNTSYSCKTQCYYCKEDHKSNSKKCPEYTRQKNIKELMAYENVTFYDANEACKKTYITKGDYIYNPQDFPQKLKEKNINNFQKASSQFTIPSQRRTQHVNTSKRSFAQAIAVNNNKKRIIHKGFDRGAHEECLFNPNSRPIVQPSTSLASLNSSQQSHVDSPKMPDSALHNFNYINLNHCIEYILSTSVDNLKTIKDVLTSRQDTGPDMDLELDSDC